MGIGYDEFDDPDISLRNNVRDGIEVVLKKLSKKPLEESDYSDFVSDYDDNVERILVGIGVVEKKEVCDYTYMGLSLKTRECMKTKGIDKIADEIVEHFDGVIEGKESMESAISNYSLGD